MLGGHLRRRCAMRAKDGVGPVVVGVDGSPSALATVEAKAREAGMGDTELRVAHTFLRPAKHIPPERVASGLARGRRTGIG
jgi:hypothetical protein